MRHRLLVWAALGSLALGCSSPAKGPRGGGGGDDGEGGSGGSSSGGTGGATSSGGKGGGGSGGSSAGGAGGSVGGAGGGSSNGGTGGNVAGAGGSAAGAGGSAAGAGGSAAGAGGSSTGGMGGSSSGRDGGATDAPPTGGTFDCTGMTGGIYCDDFEKQTAGGQPKGDFKLDINGAGTMTIDTSKAYSGKQSLFINFKKAPQGDDSARMIFTKGFPVAGNDLHGRAMVFMTAVPKDNDIHWDLSSADAPGGIEYTIGSMYGNVMAVYQPGDCSLDTKTPVVAGKWMCFQWEFKGAADGTHLLSMKVDGQPTMPGTVTDGREKATSNCVGGGAASREWKAGTWNQVSLGWIAFQNSNIPVEMWIDDVVLGPKEVPCQ